MPARLSVSTSRAATRRVRGLVLLALLLALALGGILMMMAGEVWWRECQRERERELLFVGDQFRLALQRYYFGAPPGAPRTLPARLEDLLEDNRYPMPVRHLRRLYVDPMTGRAEWGLARSGDRIAGVYSLSAQKPVKQANFPPEYQTFNAKTSYRDWLFAVPATIGVITVSPAASGARNGDAALSAPSQPNVPNPS